MTPLETALDTVSPNPVFVFGNHHTEQGVQSLVDSSIEEGTAVFYPIGSVQDHGEAIVDLGTEPGWRVLTTFVTPPLVDAVAEGAVEYVPVRASDHTAFVRQRFADRHVVLVCHVPSTTVDGAHTFGLACPHAPELFDWADTTVAVRNDAIPVVSGPTRPVDSWDIRVSTTEPLPSFRTNRSPIADEIGENVASLVPNGATIQLGIGSIPNAVSRSLSGKSTLSVHSGVISDGLLALIESGVVSASPDRPAITSQVIGETETFYERLENQDAFELKSSATVHDPCTMAAHERFVTINGAIEVDLSGQVNASHIGTTQYAAPGGLPDFVEGTRRSPNGSSIVAMQSRANEETPKIVPNIGAGARVDVSRTNVDYVVTENGIADLRNNTRSERAEALIEIAHPDDRPQLRATIS
ncbi:hypothetical protein GS429_00250 [Natronorubrum sp. JWXQ-INN-674]|uniref:Acetyl-CoA hydrolase/transferase C-terminal domain-containing protein n=1 Tax=Natronorubrum halalkaliphilum TaxID=2691917 RepID=A0A6B0VGL6_9EURY|nr:acetyl-CoA hydrolase/transferase C-terminal domain-containing protein [Natronorubrum halalkaliphilum]MXV60523.1 hypothetical protein [Natronorubrum halalkaliphilum]